MSYGHQSILTWVKMPFNANWWSVEINHLLMTEHGHENFFALANRLERADKKRRNILFQVIRVSGIDFEQCFFCPDWLVFKHIKLTDLMLKSCHCLPTSITYPKSFIELLQFNKYVHCLYTRCPESRKSLGEE